MATIWFLKSGETQSGASIAEKSLDWCVQSLGLRPDNWIASLETRHLTIDEKEDSRRAPFGGFSHAVVRLSDAEISDKCIWKPGLYLLSKHATEVKKILDELGEEKKPVHTHNRECPVCKGMCKFVRVNSLTPYEEIEAEIKRRQRLKTR